MELAVEKRDITHKPKALREKGLLPAVVYGRSEESTPISVNRKDFEKLFRKVGESTVITLKGLAADKDALIHEVAVDPLSGLPVHADFYAIEKGQTVTVSVPLEFTGVSEAVRAKGAILVKVMHELEIECEPKDLPHGIAVDISKLENIDDKIFVKDLAIPAKAKLTASADDVVCMAVEAKEEVEEVAAPIDLSSIETSVERGKKEVEGEPAAEAGSKE